MWIGYNQSLRPGQSGLTLNTDITAAAFLEGQPMLQLIGGTVGMQNISGGLNPQQVRLINKAVRGVQVNITMLLLAPYRNGLMHCVRLVHGSTVCAAC